MKQLGIWSDAAGGFIETGLWSDDDALNAIARLVADGETRDDLTVMNICPEHDEQPEFGCDECAAECRCPENQTYGTCGH